MWGWGRRRGDDPTTAPHLVYALLTRLSTETREIAGRGTVTVFFQRSREPLPLRESAIWHLRLSLGLAVARPRLHGAQPRAASSRAFSRPLSSERLASTLATRSPTGSPACVDDDGSAPSPRPRSTCDASAMTQPQRGPLSAVLSDGLCCRHARQLASSARRLAPGLARSAGDGVEGGVASQCPSAQPALTPTSAPICTQAPASR